MAGTIEDVGERVEPLAVTQFVRRIQAMPTTAFVAVVAGIALLRSGVNRVNPELFLNVTTALPEPTTGHQSGTLVSPLIARAIGVDTPGGWLRLHLVLVPLVLAVVAILATRRHRDPDRARFVLVVLASSSIVPVMTGTIGFYDVWMLLGAAVLVHGGSWQAGLIGGLLMGATNTEQTVVALGCLAVIVVALDPDRRLLPAILAALVAVVISRAGLAAWYSHYDLEPESRAGLLGANLSISANAFVQSAPASVFAWFSAAWLVIVESVRSWAIAAALIVVPAAASITTLDGTRVFVCVCLPGLLYVVHHVASTFDAARLHRMTGATLVLMVLTPGIVTWGGYVRAPWLWFA